MKVATPAYSRWGMESQLCQTDPDQASTRLAQVLLELKEEIKALGEKFNVINILKLNLITRGNH